MRWVHAARRDWTEAMTVEGPLEPSTEGVDESVELD